MKAKTVSLIAKIVAASMLVATWARMTFGGVPSEWAALVLAGGVLVIFGDVTIAIFLDKIAEMKGKPS